MINAVLWQHVSFCSVRYVMSISPIYHKNNVCLFKILRVSTPKCHYQALINKKKANIFNFFRMKNNYFLQFLCMYRAFCIDRPMHNIHIKDEFVYLKYFYMFRFICIIFRESSCQFDKVTKSVKL
jgi:hypothetical protein